jgi:RHS repeat-associated protein
LSEARTQNGVTKTASYGYFANGLQSTMTTFNGQTINFGYDAALRLTSQTDPNDGGKAITYGYDGRSRQTSIKFPTSAISQLTSYDGGGRVKTVTLQKSDGTPLQKFDYYYGFDANGVRAADYWNGFVRRVTELDKTTVSYNYDNLNRLSGAKRANTTIAPFDDAYSYDNNNNRTCITSGGITTCDQFDQVNQIIGYKYDRNGNLTGFNGNTLGYDAANKWTSGTTADGTSLQFSYDGLGRRVSRTVSGNQADYWYDITGLTQETGPGSLGLTYLRDPGGRLLSRSGGAGLYNYGQDRLGSVTAVTRSDGTLANSYVYRPYGELAASTGSVNNPFRYTSAYHDGAMGMYQMGHRYYQIEKGRFTQLDPLPKSLVSINRYAYANCNPTNFIDPTGLHPHPEEPRCSRTATFFAGVAFVSTGLGLAAALASIPATGGVSTPVALGAASAAVGTFGSGGYLAYCLGGP